MREIVQSTAVHSRRSKLEHWTLCTAERGFALRAVTSVKRTHLFEMATPLERSPENSGVHTSPRFEGENGQIVDPNNDANNAGPPDEMAAFAQVFTEYSRDGLISGDDLIDVLRECGVTTDREGLMALLSGNWDDVDYDTACDVFNSLRNTESTTMAQVVDVTKAVITITPWGFAWKVLTCSRIPDAVYNIETPKITLQPRMLLMSSTLVIMLLTCSLIIMLVALLWLDRAKRIETNIMRVVATAFSAFVDAVENELIAANGREQGDMALTLASFVDVDTQLRRQIVLSRLTREAAILAVIVNHVGVLAPRTHKNGVLRQFRTVQGLLLRSSAVVTPVTAARSRALFGATMTKTAALLRSWGFNLVVWDRVSDTFVVDEDRLCPTRGSCLTAVLPCFQVPLIGAAAPGGPFNESQTRFFVSESSPSVLGSGAAVVGAHFRSLEPGGVDAVACAMLLQSTFERRAREVVATLPVFDPAFDRQRNSRNSNPAAHKTESEKVLVAPFLLDVPAHGRGSVGWLTPLVPSHAPSCPSNNGSATPQQPPGSTLTIPVVSCFPLSALFANVLRSRLPDAVADVEGPRAVPTMVAAAPTIINLVVAVFVEHTTTTNAHRHELITEFEYLNDVRIAQGATVESVVVVYNASSNEYQQATRVAFPFSCYEAECLRRPQALTTAVTAFLTNTSGYSITPDYRPEPVVGGYAFSSQLSVAIVIERDVIEIRRKARESVVSLLDEKNGGFQGTFELQLLRVYDQNTTRLFDPFEACPRGEFCISVSGKGVIYRGDCVHCTRWAPTGETRVEYLTKPRLCKTEKFPHFQNCTEAMLTHGGRLGRLSVFSGESGVVETTDYRNVKVLGAYGQNANFTTGFYAKQDYDEVFSPILLRIIISFTSSVGMVVVAIALLMVLSQRFVVQIESEWKRFKDDIVKERRAFADVVRDMVPPQVAENLMKGQLFHVQALPVSIALHEISGMRHREENWTPTQLSYFITYNMHLAHEFSNFFGVHRLRIIGDTALFVGGLPEVRPDESLIDVPHPVRMLGMFASLYQCCMPRFAHFPHRDELIEHSFGSNMMEFPDQMGVPEQVGNILMPAYRCGVHYGTCTLAVVNTQEVYTPHFDAYGQSVALAVRLCRTCRSDGIHVTEALKDQVELFENSGIAFGSPHTTLIRGRGYVKAFHMKKADVPLPSSLLQKLGIRYSKRRYRFIADELLIRDGGSVYSRSTDNSMASSALGSAGSK